MLSVGVNVLPSQLQTFVFESIYLNTFKKYLHFTFNNYKYIDFEYFFK